MQRRDTLDDGQTEAGAAPTTRPVAANEGVEDAVELGRIDTIAAPSTLNTT